MDRRNFLKTSATSAVALSIMGLTGSKNNSIENKPNIVLFVSDDHGMDMGVYGNHLVKTPHFDSFANESVRFTNAYATTASCSASRSVLLTGMHNHRTAQYGHTHDYHHFSSYDHIRSLPMLLKEGGYRTASVGKFHVANEEVYHFEKYIEGNLRNPVEMAENSRPFIKSKDDKPFFLYFATSDPHRGGGLMAGETTAKTENPIPGVNSFGNKKTGYEDIKDIEFDPGEIKVPKWLPDNEATRAELVEYYRSIWRLDQGFGRLIKILKDEGLYDNTIVIYLSDHGPAFAGAKTTVYDPGLMSPLLVRYPEGKNGSVCDAMISWVDITPTLLDAAGISFPQYMQHIQAPEILEMFPELPKTHSLHGRSFLPWLRGENPEGWDTVFASHTFHEIQMYYPMRMIRDRKYKLILNVANGLDFPFSTDLWASATWQSVYKKGMATKFGMRTVNDYIHRPKFELYDIENDPNESINLADDPDYKKILDGYKNKLKNFQIRSSDPWISKWIYE